MRAGMVSCVLALAACTEAETTRVTGAGGGGEAGGEPTCAPGEALLEDGACEPAGVPEGSCPAGFAFAEGGCIPILPEEPCPSGEVALPGETTCRPLAECGDPPWGNIPLEPDAQHVDQSFGGVSDGSIDGPWTTVQSAVNAATNGDMIAIAAGVYSEEVATLGKTLRVWGRCPAMTELTAPAFADLLFLDADGMELHTLAMTAMSTAPVFVHDASDVLIDRVWVHDTPDIGILIGNFDETTSGRIVDTLVENVAGAGISIYSADFVVERTVIRDVEVGLNGPGRGVSVELDPQVGLPASVELTGSIIERVRESGIAVIGSDLVLSDSVIRDVRPREDDRLGIGLAIQSGNGPATGIVTGAYLGHNRMIAVSVLDADASLLHTTIDAVLPQLSMNDFGDGLCLVDSTDESMVVIERSLISGATRAGLANFSGVVALEGVGFACNTIHLDGESIAGPYELDVRGGNACWCDDTPTDCKVLSEHLEPPPPP